MSRGQPRKRSHRPPSITRDTCDRRDEDVVDIQHPARNKVKNAQVVTCKEFQGRLRKVEGRVSNGRGWLFAFDNERVQVWKAFTDALNRLVTAGTPLNDPRRSQHATALLP